MLHGNFNPACNVSVRGTAGITSRQASCQLNFPGVPFITRKSHISHIVSCWTSFSSHHWLKISWTVVDCFCENLVTQPQLEHLVPFEGPESPSQNVPPVPMGQLAVPPPSAHRLHWWNLAFEGAGVFGPDELLKSAQPIEAVNGSWRR